MDIRQAVVLAGMVRLRPVFLTAVTTILGLLPIVTGMDINFYRWPNVVLFGSEGGTFWKPMAYSVIYGLGFATLLTLIVVPVLYSLTEGFRETIAAFRNWLANPETRVFSRETLDFATLPIKSPKFFIAGGSIFIILGLVRWLGAEGSKTVLAAILGLALSSAGLIFYFRRRLKRSS